MAPELHVGLSSYTYPWAVGVSGDPPPNPLTALELVDRAGDLGVTTVQIADNLPLDRLADADLRALRERAARRGVQIEVGTRGIGADHLRRYLDLAQAFGSPILRVVTDRGPHEPSPAEIVAALRPHEADFRRAGVRLALENHDRLTSATLAAVITELGTDWVGCCLDTVNSFGALEGPDVVLGTLGPLAINVHVKDFDVTRANSDLGFDVRGTPVGAGRLDLDALVAHLSAGSPPITAVIELWTPRQIDLAATVALERSWAEQSVGYLTGELSRLSGRAADAGVGSDVLRS